MLQLRAELMQKILATNQFEIVSSLHVLSSFNSYFASE
jgi:hypothetical protein